MATISAPAFLRRRLRESDAAGVAAEAAGAVLGRLLSFLPLLPGIGGAAMISVGAGEFAGHVFGHGLAPWVAVTVGGVFALLLDRQL